MKRLLLISLVIVLACSLIFGGCAKQATAPTPQETPIKIGIMYPLTGPIAMTGELLVKGAEFGFEEVNYEVAGRKIEVIVEDSGATPEMSVDKAKKLVEYDKVAMLIGPLISGTKLAVGAYMSKAGVPHIATQQSAVEMFEYEWSFLVGGSEPQFTYIMGLHAYDKMGLRTVTVITEDNASGHGFLDAFMDAFESRGGQVIQEQYSPFPCQDFATYLVTLKDADATVAWFEGPDAIRFLTQYHEFGIRKRMPLVGAFLGSFFQPFILHQLPLGVADAMIGERCPTGWTPLIENDLSKQFVEGWQKKYQRLPEDVQASSYLGARAVLETLKITGGDTTPEKLRQALLTLEFETPDGLIHMDPETNCAIRPVWIGEIAKMGEEYMLAPVHVYENVPPRGY